MNTRVRKSLTMMVLAALTTSTVWAAPPPAAAVLTAGSIATNLDQNRQTAPAEKEAKVNVVLQEIDPAVAGITVQVKQVVFTGQQVYSQKQLQAIIAPDVKDKMNFRELQGLAHKVTLYLQAQGYMTALVYLPKQDVTGGTVHLDVLLGKYGERTYDNRSELRTSRVEGLSYLSRSGRYIKRDEMDRLLLIINDVPGVRAHAFLSPGTENGTAATRFELTTTERCGGVIFADNYGSRYTGRNRYGARYHYNNLTHRGDQLQIGYLRTSGHLDNYDFRYELPVGNLGTFAGLAHSKMNYELGEQFRSLNAYGSARNWEIYARTPLKRTLNHNQYLRLSHEWRDLSDHVEASHYTSLKTANVWRVSLEGDDRDAKDVSNYKLTHSFGNQNLDSEDARRNDVLGTAGHFQKTELNFFCMHRVNSRWTWQVSVTGMYGWKNLDSSEKIYIGGYNAVRAYPQGEAGGDMGYLSTGEVRWQTRRPEMQLAAFVDAGWVRFSKDPGNSSGSNSRTLSGAGLALLWTVPGKGYARLDYAVPLSDSYSESDGKKVNGRWWFQVVRAI